MSLLKNIFDLDYLGILISIIFGLGGIALGLFILWQGYFTPIPKVEDYLAKQVIFENCLFDEKNDIALEVEGELYKLNHTFLVHTENPKLLLCNNSEITVWVHKNAKSPYEIRGIKTPNYHMPIERGLIFDDYTQHIFFGWIMVVCGLIVLTVGVISRGDLLTF